MHPEMKKEHDEFLASERRKKPVTPRTKPARSEEACSLDRLIRALREQQKGLTAERRHELWGEIQEGYCEHCGSEYLPCYCHPCFDE